MAVVALVIAGTAGIAYGTGLLRFGNRQGSPVATSPTPTTLPPAAVLVGFPDGGSQNSYVVSIVGTDGKTIASAHALQRSRIGLPVISGPAAIYMPLVNVGGNDVYYLSGGTEVRLLARDGSTRTVTTLPGSATAHAAFAVSPDERRIAVSVLDYSASLAHPEQPISVASRLYVEDLATHANRVEVFTSSTLDVWPIAWHAGRLVLAVGTPYTQQGIVMNPYSAGELHVVDAVTGERIATIGAAEESGCWPTGLLSAVGIACYTHTATAGGVGSIEVRGWNGAVAAGSPSYDFTSSDGEASVSPDGSRLAVRQGLSPVIVRGGAGTIQTALATDPRATWPCWIDSSHVMSSRSSDYSPYQGAVPNSIVDLETGRVVATQALGMCAAVTPSDVR